MGISPIYDVHICTDRVVVRGMGCIKSPQEWARDYTGEVKRKEKTLTVGLVWWHEVDSRPNDHRCTHLLTLLFLLPCQNIVSEALAPHRVEVIGDRSSLRALDASVKPMLKAATTHENNQAERQRYKLPKRSLYVA